MTRSLLTQYLTEFSQAAFEPGQIDCALFAAGWVDRVKGTRLQDQFKGSYSTIEGGLKHLKSDLGFESLGALVEASLNPVASWMHACDGDIALIKTDGQAGVALGLVGGAHIHVLAPVRGLDVMSLDRAWRVYRP